jgi:apolipoprotein N-acyltransferase
MRKNKNNKKQGRNLVFLLALAVVLAASYVGIHNSHRIKYSIDLLLTSDNIPESAQASVNKGQVIVKIYSGPTTNLPTYQLSSTPVIKGGSHPVLDIQIGKTGSNVVQPVQQNEVFILKFKSKFKPGTYGVNVGITPKDASDQRVSSTYNLTSSFVIK